MKLELKHLAPYLPYGLKIQGQTHKDIEELSCVTETSINIVGRGFTYGMWADIFDIKPILRPLSDLTKDIEYRGEKFVPLKKLHELDETNYFGNTEEKGYKLRFMDKVISVKHNTYKLSGTEEFVVKYLVETSNIGDLIYSFSYDPELRRFLKRDDTRSIPLGIGYQLDMFNKLFEWNFDVFGLIDKGLAIDINTL